jgi:hypothetical protein
VIASQEEVLFLLVPYGEAESAGQMLDALFAPTLPCGQQHGAIGHHSYLLAGETQLQAKFYTVVETYIRNHRGDPSGRQRLFIEIIFR